MVDSDLMLMFSACSLQTLSQRDVTLDCLCFLQVPEEFDVDKEHAGDCLMSPEYAKDIFDYLREREVRVPHLSEEELSQVWNKML